MKSFANCMKIHIRMLQNVMPAIANSMPHGVLLFELYSTIKRDGRVVSFKPEKISAAIAKAFLAHSAEDLNAILERANKLTDIVISDIRRLWPEGKVIHIEEIQDLVGKGSDEGRLSSDRQKIYPLP